MSTSLEVLVVGGGPAGLALAADLLRRDVRVRVVSAAPEGFAGSRAKGLQPRTQEVLDDLGVLPEIRERAGAYPKLGVHLGPFVLPRRMYPRREPSESVPYPDTLLIGQYDTDAALRHRVEALGGAVEFDTRLTALTQDADGVDAMLEGPGGTETVRARYLVGADGAASTVRSAIGVEFLGTTDESDRMIVADLGLRGLSRRYWHVWPRTGGRFMALCPMPGRDTFQLMLRIPPGEEVDVSREAIAARIHSISGTRSLRVDAVAWSSVWRPNIRLASRYRVGRVFLAGDAAHVHPPTGAQGLNTGVQDAYNLGWKLGQVLAGADAALLDTYEAERQPVAAGVLGLSSRLYTTAKESPIAAMARGDEERQLALTYRGGPLAVGTGRPDIGVVAGDRAPDVRWTGPTGRPERLFDQLRGPHLTLLALGDEAVRAAPRLRWPSGGAELRQVPVTGAGTAHVASMFGVEPPAHVLIRPDGYVAYTAGRRWIEAASDFAARALPHSDATNPGSVPGSRLR